MTVSFLAEKVGFDKSTTYTIYTKKIIISNCVRTSDMAADIQLISWTFWVWNYLVKGMWLVTKKVGFYHIKQI